ncbi:MAG: hypothetical protein PHC51_14475 [bacterium]|nr:hypothetical protein [bacterium]
MNKQKLYLGLCSIAQKSLIWTVILAVIYQNLWPKSNAWEIILTVGIAIWAAAGIIKYRLLADKNQQPPGNNPN